MRIDQNGNVGINVTDPDEKLEVNGNVKATTFIGSGSSLTDIDPSTTYQREIQADINFLARKYCTLK